MAIQVMIDSWLTKALWYKGDTSESLAQKVFLLRNFLLPVVVLGIDLLLLAVLNEFQLLLLISPLLLYLIFIGLLMLLIKRGVKWFLYITYSGYIIVCCLIILKMGGLSNSSGVWGGAFICYLLAIGIKNKTLLITNSIFYTGCILILTLSYSSLTPYPPLTPRINNLFFTINEIWMCLYLVKVIYDNLILKTHEAINRADYLQELNILKSKFYSGLADELRSPLTLITLRAKELEEKHTGKITEYATSVILNSNKILQLINQLQDLSNLDEGNNPPVYSQCNLPELLRFWVNSLQGLSDSKSITIHFPETNHVLMADLETDKLEKVFTNILSNAIKYTPEGGHIYINYKIADIHLSHDKSDNGRKELEISVKDTGIGIPADQLENIFIRFYRIDNKNYPYQEGSGIGLSLVKEYLKLMNGSVKVNSTPGKGTEFVILLPFSQQSPVVNHLFESTDIEQTSQKITPALSVKSNSRKQLPEVLIIEDNKGIIGFLKMILEGKFTVTASENGEAGIKQAIKNIPDIIICDLMMPGKDGYAVCKELKSDFRTNHIPVVILTALESTAVHTKAMEHGADAFLTKPFTKKELLACLNNLLIQREIIQVKFTAGMHAHLRNEKDQALTNKFLLSLLDLLEKNYSNDWYGITHLCKETGISRTQLHRKLIALTGQPASNFIRNFRLEKGRKMLINTNKTIQEIAYTVGFADANYFSKSFVKEFGLPASELRSVYQISNPE